jgi:hypothetical protein
MRCSYLICEHRIDGNRDGLSKALCISMRADRSTVTNIRDACTRILEVGQLLVGVEPSGDHVAKCNDLLHSCTKENTGETFDN